jgi:hypothetical protein
MDLYTSVFMHELNRMKSLLGKQGTFHVGGHRTEFVLLNFQFSLSGFVSS